MLVGIFVVLVLILLVLLCLYGAVSGEVRRRDAMREHKAEVARTWPGRFS